MKVTSKPLENSQVELTIEVSVEELQPHIDEAAKRISKEVEIKGFRKGKVPYDVLAKHVGEATIYEEAFNSVVESTYPQAVDEQKLQVVGRADITPHKVAPGNPLVYTATVPLMPEITLGDYKKLKAKKGSKPLDEKKFEKTITDLRRMRATEKLVNREAKDGDKVMIDFDVKIGKVSIEGGQGTNQALALGEGRFIPGFEENISGMKKGESKNFKTTFPADYHKKDLQGKAADVDVTLNEVYEIELPEMTDEWAKESNFETVDALKKELRENLVRELEQEVNQEFETAVIDEILEKSTIGTLPDQLVEDEAKKMLSELKHDISQQQGLQFEDYLIHIKKTEDELLEDFKTQAVKRIQAALILRELAVAEDIKVEASEIQAEIDEMKKLYGQIPEMVQQIESPQHRTRLENQKIHEKLFAKLAEYSVGKVEKKSDKAN
ncbi:MAG: trigger factor [Candidatus Kerfeldbacteria bacterium CG15_BIG_FIL_POST_REV_8_21_14_020_45_12]|uniref:Trigger factor n=1 Tax=Candidatus Kerfeldbacteria bacterium CG15_BIG_FIL_POST_REV_8_21_14_020_45_12 TaxID=2014247 RepID=A0A2M7H2S0_9BACT|nr:MAG: trigger factor [Candidatus Kerfeldbacteria bacterium CG15_BIG_FIL_POST_REV_8_21_14_020_45_12]PJA93241.1 MAG: trigger factor [Candidatus Kerfeldbacteria bacterium CG_4_9_14_3_um_filter_45_8]